MLNLSFFHSNFNIDYCLFTQISTVWSIWTLALKFQHFDWVPTLSSNFNVFIDSPFHSNLDILINLPLSFCTQISTFWSILNVVLKFQYSDQFLIFQSNSNNLIDFYFCNRISTFDRSPLFRSNFNILIDLTFCTQISTFWSIPILLHSSVNFLIDSPLFTQNTTFWTIWWLALKFDHFDWFPIQSNSNILIDSHFGNKISTFDRYQIFTHISTFWSIWHFALKFQHFDQFPPYCNQTSTFWLIPNFSLTIHHFERFGD